MVTLFPLLFSPHVIRRIFFKTMYNDDLSRKIKMNDPEMGIWRYSYNEYSEMTNQLDARTNTVAFSFDTRGRLTNKSARYGFEDDFVTLAEYEYGTNGYQYNRLVKVTENDGTTGDESYFYDILGTATNISRFISGAGTYQRGFAYDALGRITTVVYPHKADNAEPYTIRYEYHEQNGLLNKISEVDSAGAFKTNLLSGISYDHYGRRKIMTYGNNVATYYSYDVLTGLLNNQEVMKNGTLQNVNYLFDAAGNVLSKEDVQNGVKHEYGYDDLNRLLSSKLTMTSAEPGQQEDYDETFSYDPLGNILTKDKQGGYGYSDYVYTRAHAVESYTYTRNNLGTPEETDVNIEYDANGNMAKKIETTDVISKTTTYEWDIENRLSVVKEGSKVISSYLYDHTGERLKKTANGSSVYYLGGMSQIKADANNSAQHFIFDGVNRIAAAVTKCSNNNDRFWMHTDHIGSTSMITSAAGEKIQRLVYKAFGKIHAHWENGSWSLGETALLGGIGFTGQEHDDETGLMYYGARYYDAGMGRFISADTMVPDPMNTQDYGRYTYVRNNPIRYTDPSGHTPEDEESDTDDDAMLIPPGETEPYTQEDIDRDVARAQAEGTYIAGEDTDEEKAMLAMMGEVNDIMFGNPNAQIGEISNYGDQLDFTYSTSTGVGFVNSFYQDGKGYSTNTSFFNDGTFFSRISFSEGGARFAMGNTAEFLTSIFSINGSNSMLNLNDINSISNSNIAGMAGLPTVAYKFWSSNSGMPNAGQLQNALIGFGIAAIVASAALAVIPMSLGSVSTVAFSVVHAIKNAIPATIAGAKLGYYRFVDEIYPRIYTTSMQIMDLVQNANWYQNNYGSLLQSERLLIQMTVQSTYWWFTPVSAPDKITQVPAVLYYILNNNK